MLRINESGSFGSLIALGTTISSSTKYNGAAAGATGLDTKNFNELYIRLETTSALTSGGVVVTVIASAENSPVASDITTLASFGTLVASTVYTGLILTKGYGRYVWIKTVASGTEAGTVHACGILNAVDRAPAPTGAVAGNSDTFNVNA